MGKLKLVSFNVNGIRAIMKKDFTADFNRLNADVFCLQETKAQDDQVAEALTPFKDYHLYSFSAVKKGYSGTAVLTKTKPLSVHKGIGIAEHDDQGRALTVEFEGFFLTNVYVPNSGNALLRLDYRQTWDTAFLQFLKNLEKQKPVIVCGDLNVAHKEIDLARPKANYNKSAGFMQEEIDGIDNYVANGLADTFRYIHPDKRDAYSWWSYRGGARDRNVGWRIDYFLASESILPKVTNAEILSDVYGSDHCPVLLEMEL